MPKKIDFVHLHTHTEYSLLDGAIRISDLIQKCKDNNMPAAAITDHGNMFGAIQFYLKARKAGIKPIIGVEVYVAPNSYKSRTEKKNYHLLLLAKNLIGYKNLLKLVSISYLEGFYYRPRVDKALLNEYSEGLIASSACIAGEIQQYLIKGNKAKARASAEEYAKIFGEGNFYMEIQDHLTIDDEKISNEQMIPLANELGLPLIATNDAHYLNKEDFEAHDVLLCIQTGKNYDDEKRLRFGSKEIYFKTPEEMQNLFSYIPEALSNTLELANKCNLEIPLGDFLLPHFPIPNNYENLDKYLIALSYESAEKRYGEITAKIKDRLEFELDTIIQMGYPGYFLIVQDFIQAAKDKGIPVGPGRGSAAGSIIAYVLGITNIDPLKYDLLFERFLNPERLTMPNIDIDF